MGGRRKNENGKIVKTERKVREQHWLLSRNGLTLGSKPFLSHSFYSISGHFTFSQTLANVHFLR